MITLYARQEPTTDETLLKYEPEAQKFDTVIYNNRECTEPKARIPWHHKGRPVRRGHVTLNCYRWKLQWLPTIKRA